MKAVSLERQGPVAWLALDRPPLNVLDIATMRQFAEGLGAAAEAKVVVVVARGKAFCAGVDVADHTPDKIDAMLEVFHALVRALWSLPQPVIAAVQGAALGGGMELALACDLVIAAEGARFGQPEIKVGAFPPVAALLLPGLVGRQAALECVLRGEAWSARRAFELGLVNAVVPGGQLAEAAAAWARELAALSGPILTLAKRAVRIGWDEEGLEARLARIERLYRDELVGLEDAQEGLRAFLEKRKPQWRES